MVWITKELITFFKNIPHALIKRDSLGRWFGWMIPNFGSIKSIKASIGVFDTIDNNNAAASVWGFRLNSINSN